MSSSAVDPSADMLVSYVTDVEGNMTYFQRWVEESQVVCWVKKSSHGSNGPPPAEEGETMVTEPLPQLTYADLDCYALGFRQIRATKGATQAEPVRTQFVYGGDAFDHGSDLVFCRALLDFKRRFPSRVHLILGNRDVNKMVVRHIFGPAAPRDGTTTDPVLSILSGAWRKRLSFTNGVAGMNPREAEEKLFPIPTGPLPKISYTAYLEDLAVGQDGKKSTGAAHPVSFMKWALIHRLGSPGAFEHRRRELQALQEQIVKRGGDTSIVERPLTDEDVAASFALAAEPGGVYYEYLREGELLHVISPVLFVHGGICEENLGLVPAVEAPYHSPLKGCQRLVDVLYENGGNEEVNNHTVPTPNSSLGSSHTDTYGEKELEQVSLPPAGTSPIPWFNALHAFKSTALHEYTQWTANKGNALRRYGNHCFCTTYSVTVNSLIKRTGPSYFSLPVVEFLLSNGLEMVCVGHMPTGDTPAIIRQPPGGVLTCIAADNSYSGRGNSHCTPMNPRGKAVTEVLLAFTAAPPEEGAESTSGPCFSSVVAHLHGQRADGTPFRFAVSPDEEFLGRCIERKRTKKLKKKLEDGKEVEVEEEVSEYWWVKRRETKGDGAECHYGLHCTNDSYFSEQEETFSLTALQAALADTFYGGVTQDGGAPSTVGGLLRDVHTRESLRNEEVHRIKTKVKPPPS